MSVCPNCGNELLGGTEPHICPQVLAQGLPEGALEAIADGTKIVEYTGKPIRIVAPPCNHYWFEYDRGVDLTLEDDHREKIYFQCHHCKEKKFEVIDHAV